MTDERRKVEVRDVMKKKYDIIDGMMSVNEAMKAMKYREFRSRHPSTAVPLVLD